MTGFLIAIAIFAWFLLAATVASVARIHGFSFTEFFIYSIFVLPLTSLFVVYVSARRAETGNRRDGSGGSLRRRGFATIRGFTVIVVGGAGVVGLLAFGPSPGRVLSYFERTAAAAIDLDECAARVEDPLFECLQDEMAAFEWTDVSRSSAPPAQQPGWSFDPVEVSVEPPSGYASIEQEPRPTTRNERLAGDGHRSPDPDREAKKISPLEIRIAQRLLRDLGHNPGPADGKFGPRTLKAIIAYQRESAVETDGRLTHALIERLTEDHDSRHDGKRVAAGKPQPVQKPGASEDADAFASGKPATNPAPDYPTNGASRPVSLIQ